MHRSSESVAAIATALAKAQIELSNPEKAMVGLQQPIRHSTKLPLRIVIERPRHCAQDLRRPADRGRANYKH
jgi:hypothetical protein